MLKTLFKIGDRVCLQNDPEFQGNVIYAELKPNDGIVYLIKKDDGSKIEKKESELMLIGIIWREKFQPCKAIESIT